MSDAIWTFAEAKEACRISSHAQQAAEEGLRDAARALAVAEEAYRIALAQKIAMLHAEGAAWSVCADLARGDKQVAELRRRRDIAEGVREACVHAAWRRASDRRDTQRFVDYSFRRELAESGPGSEQPTWSEAA